MSIIKTLTNRLTSRPTDTTKEKWLLKTLLLTATACLSTLLFLFHLKQGHSAWSEQHDTQLDAKISTEHVRLNIPRSPQVVVKSTFTRRSMYIGKGDYVPVDDQNGAWIQIRLPSVLRGSSISLNVISSTRPLGVFPSRKDRASIQTAFTENGQFIAAQKHGQLPFNAPQTGFTPPPLTALPEKEDVIWQTWVPLDKDSDYIELQIWYPTDLLSPSVREAGYLYQLRLGKATSRATEGLGEVDTQVRKEKRQAALQLFVIP